MSTLPNADAARDAAARMPDLPAFLARREAGHAPTVKPMAWGSPAAAPAASIQVPGVTAGEAAFAALARLLARPEDIAKDGTGLFEPKSGGAVLYCADGPFIALVFRHGVAREQFTVARDLKARSLAVTVVQRANEEMNQMPAADMLSAFLTVLHSPLAAASAGKIKLARLVRPADIPAPRLPPMVRIPAIAPAPAFARALAAIDTGAPHMPDSMDGMTNAELAAELAPFQVAATVSAAWSADPSPVMVVELATETRPAVVIPMRGSRAGRAFPASVQTAAVDLLPPQAAPVAFVPPPVEDLEAKAEALVLEMQAAVLRERGISAPLEAFEVEEDRETGALVCREDAAHPCWAPKPKRVMAPRAAAAPTAVAQAPAAGAAYRARKGLDSRTPIPQPAAAPAAAPAPKRTGAAKKKPQGIDFDAFIGKALENALTAAAAKIGAAVDQKVSEALARALGN